MLIICTIVISTAQEVGLKIDLLRMANLNRSYAVRSMRGARSARAAREPAVDGPAPLRPPRRAERHGGLVALVYAISQAPEAGWGSAQTVALLAASAVLLVGFLVVETRSEAPLLPLHLFRSSTVAGANVVGLLLGASFFAFIFVGTLYMQQVLGYSALKTGLAWLAASLTSVAFAGLSQMLVTKTSAKVVMAFGMALIGGGILWATQVTAGGNFWHNLAGPFFVAGAGTAFAFIPVSIAALAGVRERDAGVASGLLNTSQQLGGAIGVAVASSIAASRAHSLAHLGYSTAGALTGGFSAALWVCGLVGVAAVPITFVLVHRQELAQAVAASVGREAPALVPADQ